MRLTWSHMVIKVRDLDLMVAFYREVLGFEISDQGPLFGDSGPHIVFMTQTPTDHHQIAFAQVRADEGEPNSVDHIAFRVDSLAEVREMMDRVAKDGRIGEGAPVTHGNALSVYFKDPEGNGIEVFCDTPWHVRQPVIGPWDPSKSDAEVLRETEAQFQDKPDFQPMDDYRAESARRFADG
jgi:catechol 2,3-dioxygenase-like lactoylglutathione lyase family enzyme